MFILYACVIIIIWGFCHNLLFWLKIGQWIELKIDNNMQYVLIYYVFYDFNLMINKLPVTAFHILGNRTVRHVHRIPLLVGSYHMQAWLITQTANKPQPQKVKSKIVLKLNHGQSGDLPVALPHVTPSKKFSYQT